VIYTNTSSGSLADKMGMEHLVASVFFVLHIDKDPAQKINITNFTNEGGRLKITWEKYNRPNFMGYILWKGLDYYSPYRIVSNIDDPSINYAYDDEYIGGEEKYWIETYVNASERMTKGNDTIIDLSKSRIRNITKDEETGFIKVVWDTCKFNAFQSYHLSAHLGDIPYFSTDNYITNINVTTNGFNELPFGLPLEIVLEVNSKNLNRTYDKVSFAIGEKSQPFHFLDYQHDLDRYFRIYSDTLHVRGPGISEVKTILPNFGSGSFKECFIRNNSLYILLGTKLYLYSTANFSLKKTIELQDLVGPFDEANYSSLTENEIFVFQKSNRIPPYSIDSLKMVDLKTGSVLMSKTWFNQYAISLDGRFLYAHANCYEWDGNNYTLFKEKPEIMGPFPFANKIGLGSMITGNYQILSIYKDLLTNKYECSKYDIQNDLLGETLTVDAASEYFWFDSTHEVIYGNSVSKFGRLALCLIKDNGKQSLEILNIPIVDGNFRYLNDTLFCGNGYKLFLKS